MTAQVSRPRHLTARVTDESDGSLLVVLHLPHRPNHGVVWVLAGLVTGSALPKQVPALVECTFQPSQLLLLIIGSQLALLNSSPQFVFLIDERSHLLENLLFVHEIHPGPQHPVGEPVIEGASLRSAPAPNNPPSIMVRQRQAR